jgi:hypothetical protein
MSAAEVTDLLCGGPPGVEDAFVASVSYVEDEDGGLFPSNTIEVHFSKGKVTSKYFRPWAFADFLQRVRYRLRL